jgi:DNA-binding NtrC family response regulator
MKEYTILYIDDDVYSLLLLKEQLKDTGINVITEKNGKLGLKRYMELKDKINLVLIDLKLPYMNGNDILLKIRKINKNIPVVIMTANSLLEEREQSLKLGASDFYVKPIKRENTDNIINKHIKLYAL